MRVATDRPGLNARMPCRQLTKAGRRDGESERRTRQHYSGLCLLRDAAAERGVRGRLDGRACVDEEKVRIDGVEVDM